MKYIQLSGMKYLQLSGMNYFQLRRMKYLQLSWGTWSSGKGASGTINKSGKSVNIYQYVTTQIPIYRRITLVTCDH